MDDLQGTLIPAPTLVPKPLGWRMILTSEGNAGWHLIEHANSEGGVTTLCGIVGRPVPSSERLIARCRSCDPAVIG